MDERERQSHLFLVVDSMLEKRREWVESDTPYITEELEVAIDELVEVFSTGMLPGTCRALEAAVTELSRYWWEWKDRVANTGLTTILPGNGFWKAVEAMAEARERAKPRPSQRLEAVRELVDQKVPAYQICEIYGWKDEFGRPETWKIGEELAEPGKHTSAESGWVDPLEKRRREEQARREAIVRRLAEKQARKVENANRKPPESLEELVGQGVPLHQIAAILQTTEAAVLAECDRLGIGRPADLPNVHAVRAPQEPEVKEEVARAMNYAMAGKMKQEAQEAAEVQGFDLDGVDLSDEGEAGA